MGSHAEKTDLMMPQQEMDTASILVLHDPTTLKHHTVELLGSKIIPALECCERITNILTTLRRHKFPIRQLQFDCDSTASVNSALVLMKLVKESHEHGYLEFLQGAHAQWVRQGLINQHESILPECFPHFRLAGSNAGKLSAPPSDLFALPGFYSFDMSAAIGEYTWISALASANLAMEAAKIAAQGSAKIAAKTKNSMDHGAENTSKCMSVFALCRPPGHHCTTRLAGGYCYINNAVIAVYALRHFHQPIDTRAHPVKIAILDLDFHHGNGTQEHFYSDPHVYYVSLHGKDEYPYYSGSIDETGEKAGLGYNLNFPLPAGTTLNDYLNPLRQALKHIEIFRPEYLIVSLGFDTFALDPLGNFKLLTEDYAVMAASIRSVEYLTTIPSILLLEGGYALDQLGENTSQFLRGWIG